jgi:hypothetical protein
MKTSISAIIIILFFIKINYSQTETKEVNYGFKNENLQTWDAVNETINFSVAEYLRQTNSDELNSGIVFIRFITLEEDVLKFSMLKLSDPADFENYLPVSHKLTVGSVPVLIREPISDDPSIQDIIDKYLFFEKFNANEFKLENYLTGNGDDTLVPCVITFSSNNLKVKLYDMSSFPPEYSLNNKDY